MKSWNEMSQEAKNKRRAGPSGKVRPQKAKKKKNIKIECRYTGDWEGPEAMFGSTFFNKEWHPYWTHYSKPADAEQAVKTMNRKEDNFEYRTYEENPKTPKGTAQKEPST